MRKGLATRGGEFRKELYDIIKNSTGLDIELRKNKETKDILKKTLTRYIKSEVKFVFQKNERDLKNYLES